jgi:hypothetical protein
MDEFDDVAFSAHLESDPQLKQLADSLQDELHFFSEPHVQFDPLTILTLISIIIQVVIYCRERRNPEDIAADIKTIKTLPPRKLIRLRRRVNRLWREQCGSDASERRVSNPMMTAVFELGENG